MMNRRRPFLSKVIPHTWSRHGEPGVDGIAIIGLGGLSAHLTPAEALDLADRLVDLSEQLEASQAGNTPTPRYTNTEGK